MNRELRMWNTRSGLVAESARRRLMRDVLAFVRSVVEDAGGEWTPDARLMARSKADSLLDEPSAWAVLLYHATGETQAWADGSRDADFPGIVRRTLKAVGGLLPRSASTRVLEFLCELSADRHGRYISPEVAENIRERMRRGGGGPDHLPAAG